MSISISLKENANSRTSLQKIVQLTLADASSFVVDGDIAGDGDAGNDGVGVIQSINGNVVNVIVSSGTFVAGNGVENANTYVGMVLSRPAMYIPRMG